MTIIELKNKQVFDIKQAKQLNKLLADFSLAAIGAWLGLSIALLFISLLAALQAASFPWTQFISQADELLFIGTCLWVFLSLPGLARYISWRALLASLKLLADRIRRSGQIFSTTICLPLTRFFENHRHQIGAYWRQLRQRLAQRPPYLWTSGQAPIKLFQQAALLLAP